MPTEIQTAAIHHVDLEGELNISSAPELKEKLVQALQSGAEVCVSLAGVSALDITAVQLLWAAVRQAATAGIPFTIAGPALESIVARMKEAGIACAPFLEGNA